MTTEYCKECVTKLTLAEQQLNEIVLAIDHLMVATHLGVFNRGDDPNLALHKLMCWSQSVGEYYGKRFCWTRLDLCIIPTSTNKRRIQMIDTEKPVAWMHETEGLSYENHYVGSVPLYPHPARTLSDEEIIDMWNAEREKPEWKMMQELSIAFARAVLEKANG